MFLRDETQYWLIPLLNIIGNGVAFFRCISASEAQNGHWLLSCYLTEVFSTLRDSLPFFYSRIATTVYTATNTIVLNIISGTGAVTGYYTSAGQTDYHSQKRYVAHIRQHVPYMVKNRDFRLIRKSLML